MNNEEIKEINQHISDALEQWSDIMVEADAKEWSFYLNYSDKDLLNVVQIFMHVASNRAIKGGVLTEENTIAKITIFKECLKDTFGIDTIKLTEEVLGNERGIEKNTEQVKYWGDN